MSIVAPSDPVTTTPAREACSVRRTTSVDILRPDGMTGDVMLHGRARDLLTGDDGTAKTIGEAALRARVRFSDRTLADLELWPEEPTAAVLVGRMVGSGFRAAINPALSGTPVYVLLDDLPVATLISGYASLRVDSGAGAAGMARAAAVYAARGDICSGWRTDGTMLRLVARDHTMPVPDCPPAPDLVDAGDPMGWHDLDGLPPGSMRRRRRIDIRQVGNAGGLAIDAMFRDSFWEADGTEVVLHEYRLDAVADEEGALGRVSAEPRVLPWPECPWAADSAQGLVGVNVADLPTVVKEQFVGTSTCTHLNDLFRSLRDVHRLSRLITAPGSPGYGR